MAARRLIVVMLVLLGLSTLVAALVPAPQSSEDGPGTPTGPAGGPGARRPSHGAGGLVTARIRVSDRSPEVVRVRPGQRLVLLVGGAVGDDISIPAFGLTETMAPTAPARFDLIVDRAGRFPIRAFGTERPVGSIVSGSAG
jgi:hypothetical protein